jgi:hypothetical protein
MFWSEDVARLERKNVELELEVVNLKNQLEALNLQIEENLKKTQAAASISTMAVDFSNIDAFSIERNTSYGLACTIIGYWVEDKDGVKANQEWFLFCSDETHEKIVSEFKKHIAKK